MSLGRRHKGMKRPTENKTTKNKKMAIGPWIAIIILNVNGLNAPTKRHRLPGWNTCSYMHFHLPHNSVWPSQIVCNYFTLLS